jgi:hypothetical protein
MEYGSRSARKARAQEMRSRRRPRSSGRGSVGYAADVDSGHRARRQIDSNEKSHTHTDYSIEVEGVSARHSACLHGRPRLIGSRLGVVQAFGIQLGLFHFFCGTFDNEGVLHSADCSACGLDKFRGLAFLSAMWSRERIYDYCSHKGRGFSRFAKAGKFAFTKGMRLSANDASHGGKSRGTLRSLVRSPEKWLH